MGIASAAVSTINSAEDNERTESFEKVRERWIDQRQWRCAGWEPEVKEVSNKILLHVLTLELAASIELKRSLFERFHFSCACVRCMVQQAAWQEERQGRGWVCKRALRSRVHCEWHSRLPSGT